MPTSCHLAPPRATSQVFLDFCSLCQKDAAGQRTKAEVAGFGRALGNLDKLYSHQFTTVLMLTELPPLYPQGYAFADAFADGTPCTPNQAEYAGRGWCFCEASMAALIKMPELLLDVAKFRGFGEKLSTHVLFSTCSAGRRPPLLPDAFATALEAKSFTSKKADLGVVSRLYAAAFSARVGSAWMLMYTGHQWSDAEGELIVRDVVPRAMEMESLNLGTANYLGMPTVKALASVLSDPGVAPKLKSVGLENSYNEFWDSEENRQEAKEALTAVRPGLDVRVSYAG